MHAASIALAASQMAAAYWETLLKGKRVMVNADPAMLFAQAHCQGVQPANAGGELGEGLGR
jgi:hypothetical protein